MDKNKRMKIYQTLCDITLITILYFHIVNIALLHLFKSEFTLPFLIYSGYTALDAKLENLSNPLNDDKIYERIELIYTLILALIIVIYIFTLKDKTFMVI